MDTKIFIKKVLAVICILSLPWTQDIALCLPENPTVVEGEADIEYPDESTMTITAADDTIINYSSFDIMENESLIINLPSIESEILNRALGPEASDILGNLSCNGIFILINESGIYVGPEAQLDVGSLVLSTRDINNEDFLNSDYLFQRLSPEQLDMLLTNAGTINIEEGGFGVLIAGAIENQGTIIAPLGRVELATGDAVRLDISGKGLISVAIEEAVANTILDSSGNPITEQLKNTGTIGADGGVVILNAQSLTNIFTKAINLEGYVHANTIEEHNGLIKIVANDNVTLNGELEATNIEIGDADTPIEGHIILEGGSIKADSTILNASDVLNLREGFIVKDTANIHLPDTGNWSQFTQKLIKWKQYYPTFKESKWILTNSASGFTAYIDQNGWRIEGEDGTTGWFWVYDFLGMGREGGEFTAYPDIANSEVYLDDTNTVFLEHGDILEWYKNTSKGLEQGFTLRERPDGEGLLTLKGALSTDLLISSSSDEGIVFATEGGDVLKYNKLIVEDREGKLIPARMAIEEQNGETYLSIIIDDANALYPLIVDPDFADKTSISDADWTEVCEDVLTNEWFGSYFSTAGDVNNDGYDDIIVGCTTVVNAPVWVYHGSADGLSATPDSTISAPGDETTFGLSVGTAGDVNNDGYSDVLVGTNDTAIVYAFYGSADGVSATEDWKGIGPAGSFFGSRGGLGTGDVNGDGYDDAIIGGAAADFGLRDRGVVYVIYGSSTGLTDVNGDSVLDLADTEDDGYDYRLLGTIQDQLLGQFVDSGDVNGDGISDIVIASPWYTNGEIQEGAIYVVHGSSTGPSASADAILQGGTAQDEVGSGLACGDINGDGYDDVVAGGKLDATNDQGGAWVWYSDGSSGLPTDGQAADWEVNCTVANSDFGYGSGFGSGQVSRPVGMADVNGDNYEDIIIGAAVMGAAAGVYVWYGSADGLAASTDQTDADWTMVGEAAADKFGNSVAFAGDVNGDNGDDIIINASYYGGGDNAEGKIYVFYGDPKPAAAAPAATATATTPDEEPDEILDPNITKGITPRAFLSKANIYLGSDFVSYEDSKSKTRYYFSGTYRPRVMVRKGKIVVVPQGAKEI